MATFELFAERQRRLKQGPIDVYVYDQLPKKLRIQIIHICRRTFLVGGKDNGKIYETALKIIEEEHGFERPPRLHAWAALEDRLKHAGDAEEALDIVEALFLAARAANERGWRCPLDEAIEDFNTRLRQSGLGYQYQSGRVFRVDSEFTHQEIVKPALRLLQQPGFEGPLEEFLSAHRHYQKSENEQALVEALKAFESTLKVIIGKRGWALPPTQTASKLINRCAEKGLFPTWSQEHLNAVVKSLESGAPTVRNKIGAHGQGALVRSVPRQIAGYGLNLVAANVVFLSECDDMLA